MTPSSYVQTRDGLALAVYQDGDPADPTVVLVHGYPDDHSVWNGLVEQLRPAYHVVTYDVRGAGASEAPATRHGYRLSQLVDDLGAVVDTVVPGKRFHLIGHDWGSIQGWEAVVDPDLAAQILSFTSISGPSLDMAAHWLRNVREHPVGTVKQLLDSSYIMAFQLPVLPELAIDRGVLDLLVSRSKRAGAARPTGRPTNDRDARNGLGLYRANFLGRMTLPQPREVWVPVQVLAPDDDAHVSSRMQREAPTPYCRNLLTHQIRGNHWVVEQDPALIAARFADFVPYAHAVGR